MDNSSGLAATVASLIKRIEDFRDMKAADGGRLSEREYFRWIVPFSPLWKTVFDVAHEIQAADADTLVAGGETDYQRGISILTTVLKAWPFPLIAGVVATTVLPVFDQNLLHKVFVGALPRLRVAADLLAGDDPDSKPGPEFTIRTDVRNRYFKVWAFLNKPGNAGKSNIAVSKGVRVNKDQVGKIRKETRPPTPDEIAERRKNAKKR